MRQLQIILNIELPQMLRFSVPGIINEFLLYKSDALAYITVGVSSTKQAMSPTAITLNGLQIHTLAGYIFHYL